MTSVVPPLLPLGINKAVSESNATKILIGNLGNDHGEIGRFELIWMLDFLAGLGVEIDKVVWPSSRICPNKPDTEVFCGDFITESGGLHHREQLKTAIINAINS